MRVQMGNLRLAHIDGTQIIAVYDRNNMYIGDIKESEILKTAKRNYEMEV